MTKEDFKSEALEVAEEIFNYASRIGFDAFRNHKVGVIASIIERRFANVIADGESAAEQDRRTAAMTEED